MSPDYVELIRRGLIRAAEGKTDAALAALSQAKQLDPTQATAFYYAAEALRMQGEHPTALREYENAARVAAASKDVRMYGRALMGRALTLESMPARLPEARQVWEKYLQFAAEHPEVTFPETARARLQVVQMTEVQRAADTEVRTRIAEREAAQRKAGRP